MQDFSDLEADVQVASRLRISGIKQLLRRLNDGFTCQPPNVDGATVVVCH